MTASELAEKQDRQLRIDAHVQADRKAKRRDRLQRYGDNRHYPAGVVKRQTRKQPRRSILGQVVHDFMVCLGVRK